MGKVFRQIRKKNKERKSRLPYQDFKKMKKSKYRCGRCIGAKKPCFDCRNPNPEDFQDV